MIKSVCFLCTYQCNAKCDYCECGPNIKTKLSREDIYLYTDQALALGTVAQIVFSGGEPTLLGDDLFEGIRYATSKGLITRVVTNASWGSSAKKANIFLDKLIDSGLTEINLSVDDLHQRWIPLERVRNVFLACQEKEFPCLIAHKQMNNYKIDKQYLERIFGTELITLSNDKDYTSTEETRLFSSGAVVPVGRMPSVPDKKDNIIYLRYDRNCSSVLRDIIIGADHNLLACCGIVTKGIPELTIGDLRQNKLIDLIDKANRSTILNWIALEGPISIAKFVTKKNPSIKFKNKYVGVCHLCNEVLTRSDVREVLANNIDEMLEHILIHRSYFEEIRDDNTFIKAYCR